MTTTTDTHNIENFEYWQGVARNLKAEHADPQPILAKMLQNEMGALVTRRAVNADEYTADVMKASYDSIDWNLVAADFLNTLDE